MPPVTEPGVEPGVERGVERGVDPAPGHATFTARALGSTIRLVVSGGGDGGAPADAEGAWAEVLDELAAVDLALSRFRDDSELTALNRRAGTGGSVLVGRRLRVALAMCGRARRLTDGRFDAGMLDVLERIGERGADLGRDAASGREPAWNGAVRSPARGWPVCVPEAAVDLGGIGKGLALRWAAARAIRMLPANGGLLLDAGGDLVAAGRAPVGGWLVGIEDPAATDPVTADPLAVVALDEGAVATSSIRVRRWLSPDGRPVHHLLDPVTRQPARTGLIAVTVASPDPAWAEVWTKALFLAGRDRIAGEARRRGLAAWWVDADGRLGLTPDARLRTAWADESRIG